ncbi:MAG TPA: hypothetical protein VNS88_07155, partial [Nitrospiraceae bacterium]|nr:hypothetical protein [Nitrospiraceae bacterium]
VRFTVHDELGCVVAKDDAKHAYAAMCDVMRHKWPNVVAASRYPQVVRQHFPQGWACVVEPEFGRNWLEAKKGNPALKKELLG